MQEAQTGVALPFQDLQEIARKAEVWFLAKALVFAHAHVVVGERPQDVAVFDLVVVVAGRHSIEFLLEKTELGDLVANGLKLPNGDFISIHARTVRMGAQFQELPNGFDCKPQIPSMLDKRQALSIMGFISPLVAPGAFGSSHQSHLFVVPYRRNFDAGCPRQVSNRQHVFLQYL